MEPTVGCPGLSRAGNPCARTPGPSGSCPSHDGNTSTPAPEQTAAPTTQTVVSGGPGENPWAADHTHAYGFNGVCTVPACGRPRPAWLIDTPTPAPAKTPLTGTAKWTRNILIGVVSLALTGALAHSVGSSLSDKVAGDTGTGSYLDLPPGVR